MQSYEFWCGALSRALAWLVNENGVTQTPSDVDCARSILAEYRAAMNEGPKGPDAQAVKP